MSEFLYLWSFNNENLQFRHTDWIIIIAINAAKFALTSALSLVALRFACQLKKIVREAVKQYGKDNPSVRKLAMTHWFIWRLVLTFFLTDLVVNVIKPVICVLLKNDQTGKLD